jgi:hypothetical protein
MTPRLMDTPLRIDLMAGRTTKEILRKTFEIATAVFAAAPNLEAVSFRASWHGGLVDSSVLYHFSDDIDSTTYDPSDMDAAFRAEAFRLERQRPEIGQFLRVNCTPLDGRPLDGRGVVSSLIIGRNGHRFLCEADPVQKLLTLDAIETLHRKRRSGQTMIHPITDGEPSAHELLACEAFFRRLFPKMAEVFERLMDASDS